MLDVVAPVGGDIWVLGQTDQAVVRWGYNALVSGNISIDLYKGRSTHIATIADPIDISLSNFAWTVPDTLDVGTQYNVRLASYEIPDLQSTGPKFEIADLASVATLEVITPASGDFWIAGQTDGATIEWTSEYLIGTVDIDLMIPKGGNNPDDVLFIADDVDVTLGTYAWTVPDDDPALLVDDAYVLITSNELPKSGQSDPFSIVTLASLVSLDIISPMAGDFWIRVISDGADVSWTSAYLTDSIYIDLISAKGNNITTTRLEAVDVNLGYTALTIPGSIPVGTNYDVLLSSKEYPEITSQVGPISILDVADVAGLAITSPLATDTWIKNELDGALIEWWSSPYTDGELRIELFEGTITKQDIIPYLIIE